MPDEDQHVVIIGGGFAGLACAQELGTQGVRTTLIDRHNHHLFQPLLYQVATAALSPADIAEPIRKMLSRYETVQVVMGEVDRIDWRARRIGLADGTDRTYDRLVIATGASYGYFGHDEWAQHAPGLKTIEDACAVRTSLLSAFEQAEICTEPVQRADLMRSVIVGGGPTGVEMAGAIAEMRSWTLAKDFRNIDPTSADVILVEAGPRLLAGFPEALSDYAYRRLQRLGVRILLNHPVADISHQRVRIGDEEMRAGTIIWAAGVRASPAGRWLDVPTDRQGRIEVDATNEIPDRPDVYALGDTAATPGDDGRPLPALAQVAQQQGRHFGRALARNLRRNTPMPPFRFRNRGNTAVIGRNAAIFDFGRFRLKGWLAWVLWAIVHVYLLVSFEKRVLVSFQWLWRYITYGRGARLIT